MSFATCDQHNPWALVGSYLVEILFKLRKVVKVIKFEHAVYTGCSASYLSKQIILARSQNRLA